METAPTTHSRPAKTHSFAWIWFVATLAVLAEGYRQAIFVSPAEATMGDLFRIFFYHVPNASLALVPPYINLLGSIGYLLWRHSNPARALAADALAIAAAELTLVLSTIGLVTGMLWARPIWGIWWTWDERLTTYLLLWLLYVSYVMVRRLSSSGQTYTLASILSIFAAVDVPITFMSIRWWRTQHPGPVLTGGKVDHSMLPAVFWNLAGWAMWTGLALFLRYKLERRRQLAAVETELAFLADDPYPTPHRSPSVDIESFANAHPIRYVHIAYAVVWGLHFGYAAWVVSKLRSEKPSLDRP